MANQEFMHITDYRLHTMNDQYQTAIKTIEAEAQRLLAAGESCTVSEDSLLSELRHWLDTLKQEQTRRQSRMVPEPPSLAEALARLITAAQHYLEWNEYNRSNEASRREWQRLSDAVDTALLALAEKED
jgi:hypothetical protein